MYEYNYNLGRSKYHATYTYVSTTAEEAVPYADKTEKNCNRLAGESGTLIIIFIYLFTASRGTILIYFLTIENTKHMADRRTSIRGWWRTEDTIDWCHVFVLPILAMKLKKQMAVKTEKVTVFLAWRRVHRCTKVAMEDAIIWSRYRNIDVDQWFQTFTWPVY